MMRKTILLPHIFKHPLSKWILLGISIRFMLAPVTAWSDTQWFLIWTRRVLGSPDTLFSFSIYPPMLHILNNLIFKPLSLIYSPSVFAYEAPLQVQQFSSLSYFFTPYVLSPLFSLVYKFPYILSDLAVGLVLYRMIIDRYNNPSIARKAFVFWFINPFTIILSSVIGQNESLMALLMLITVYLILRNALFFAGISASLSFLFKTYDAAFISSLFLIIGLVELPESINSNLRGKVNTIFKFLLGFLLPFILLFPSLKYFFLESLYFVRVSAPNLGGFNLWGAINFIPSAQWLIHWANSNFFAIAKNGFLIAGILCVIIIFLIGNYLRKDIYRALIYSAILTLAVTFLGSPLVNPHNLLPILPFIALLFPDSKYWTERFWVLSLTGAVYILFMLGPLVFTVSSVIVLQPSWINELVQTIFIYLSIPGIITPFLNYDIMTISSGIGFVTLASTLVLLKSLRHDENLRR